MKLLTDIVCSVYSCGHAFSSLHQITPIEIRPIQNEVKHIIQTQRQQQMDTVFKRQYDFILSRGEGIKACLFDHEAKQFIGNLIPYSKFQDHDYFYFDFISNKNRIALENITCIVILRSENLKLLLDELSAPFYSNYCVLFTNQIDPFALEILANADTKCVISEVHEIYLDLIKQAGFLYTTASTQRKRVADGLHSLLMSLEIAPEIKYFEKSASSIVEGNNEAQAGEGAQGSANKQQDQLFALARSLGSRIQQYNFRKAGCVLLLHRSFDMITPLLHDWHYQALIKEYIDYDNGIVKIGPKQYAVNDIFFEANMFKDIHSVGNDVQSLIKELERNKIKISNYEFEDLEEKAAHSLMVETHLSIYNAVIERCMCNKDASELEIAVLRGACQDLDKAVAELPRAAGPLALLHFLRHVGSWEEESRRFPEYRDALLRFKALYAPYTCPYWPTFDNTKDIKLSYEPPLKKMVKHAILNKLRTGAFRSHIENQQVSGPVIVYIEGGATMCEYREVMKLSAELRTDVYLVSDKVISYKDILDSNNIS